MVADTQGDKQTPASGREKRTFTRNAISLAGVCAKPGQPGRAIQILDFCPGGVYLSFAPSKHIPPPPDLLRSQIIEISCDVPTPDGVQSLRFTGRVARADQAGAGISFVNPSFEALHILNEYAKSSPPEKTRSTGQTPQATGAPSISNAEKLIRACSQKVEERIEPMAKAFLGQAAKHCFNIAGEARDIADKSAFYAAFNIFSNDGVAFTTDFLARMKNRLEQGAAVISGSTKGTKAKGDTGELSLSLVEEDVFEDWLSFTDMARAAELEHKEPLYTLERRLAALFNQAIDKENNPFGPSAISQAFQDALATLALERKVVAESCKVFKNVLCDQTGELYQDLNHILSDIEVAPGPSASGKPFQPEHATRKSSNEPPLQADTGSPRLPEADAGTNTAEPTSIHPQSAESFAPSAHPVPPAAQAFQTMPPTASADAPVGGVASSPQATEHATAAMPQSPQDWYQLIQGLTSLQQQLALQPAGFGASPQKPQQNVLAQDAQRIPASAPGQPESIVEPSHFTTEEVLSALSQIRQVSHGKQEGMGFQQDFMHKLQSALAEAVPNAESRAVPKRETNILEFGGNLFDSVLTDKLVADTVKPWLNQLSIPVIKMALRDDSLFYDKSHLARQLINRIAELELFSGASKVENAVRKKIDGLLDEIAGAQDVTPELMQKMLKEVSMLVHVQNKAYEGNIRDLKVSIEADEERAKNKEQKEKTSVFGKFLSEMQSLTGEAPPVEADPALEEFRKRVRRLKVGNWLTLERDNLQKRIRLAWISKNLDKFVFVNVQGLREETLSQDELAQYLCDGSVVVLDEGEEQLVDRAQAAMLQKMHLQLLHETSHDQLTGLINRREFEHRLTETLAKVRDSGTLSMLCYLDLAQFNVVNNTFGYEEGDRALVEASRLLKQEMGEHGVLARIGGDEFAMLFENCSLNDALQVTSRQTGAFRDYRFSSGDKNLSLSFSAGLVSIDAESESVETLLQAAETSCRIARSKGNNYVQVYRPEEDNLARHLKSVKWVSRIDEALDKNRLELLCQPIVCIGGKSVAVHHSEVLLRVPDENGKMISPVDFIMAAEHFRRMASIDRWVIENAFRWMVDRRDKLNELGGLAINLSGASLNEEGLIDFVLDRAETLKIPMEKVCFEITETVGISHLSSAAEFINELKRQTGCSFSLDDFGSGQSSYAYLKNLPVDFLKIDGAFVEKMDQNPYDFAVVKSITEIGHFMGKKIIAERVENEDVLKLLREIGVDYAQGYYVGKPRNMKILGK